MFVNDPVANDDFDFDFAGQKLFKTSNEEGDMSQRFKS